MSETRVKAADIDDWAFLYAVLEVWEEKDMWTSRWDLAPRFDFPEKVILAKARQLLKRGLLEGCGCGCRGDFELTPTGMSFVKKGGISRNRLKAYARSRAIKWPISEGSEDD